MDNGGFGNFGNILVILIPLVIIILFNIFFRRRKAEKTPSEIAMALLSDVAVNQQIAEASPKKARRKLRIGSWQRNQEKLDFLDQKLQGDLVTTFTMAEEFNRAVDASRKFKSSSYLEGVSIDKLKDLLIRSRQGLEAWFAANKDQATMTPGRRGCLGA